MQRQLRDHEASRETPAPTANYEGYFRRDNGQPDSFYTDLFDFPYLRDPGTFQFLSEDGLLLNDRTHVAMLYGSYAFRFRLNAGLGFPVQSGIPMIKLGFKCIIGKSIFPSSAGAPAVAPRRRRMWEYTLTIRSRSAAAGSSTSFNLFNQQEALDYEHAFEVSSNLSSPDFGKTTVFQSPRQIRFAARSSF